MSRADAVFLAFLNMVLGAGVWAAVVSGDWTGVATLFGVALALNYVEIFQGWHR